MEAFVYIWQDKLTDKYYIGAHKGGQDDGYICSSKYMLEEYNKRKDDFKKEVLAEGTVEEMFELEMQLLKYFDARNNQKFYNRHNGDGDFICKGVTEETKEKIRNTKRENPYVYTEEQRLKMSESAKKRPRRPCSEETKEKIRLSNKGKVLSNEIREKMSIAKVGKAPWNKGMKDYLSEETKEKMSKSQKKRFVRERKINVSE